MKERKGGVYGDDVNTKDKLFKGCLDLSNKLSQDEFEKIVTVPYHVLTIAPTLIDLGPVIGKKIDNKDSMLQFYSKTESIMLSKHNELNQKWNFDNSCSIINIDSLNFDNAVVGYSYSEKITNKFIGFSLYYRGVEILSRLFARGRSNLTAKSNICNRLCYLYILFNPQIFGADSLIFRQPTDAHEIYGMTIERDYQTETQSIKELYDMLRPNRIFENKLTEIEKKFFPERLHNIKSINFVWDISEIKEKFSSFEDVKKIAEEKWRI